MAIVKNLGKTITKYILKICLPVIPWKKKLLPKQVVSMIHTLEKDYLAAVFSDRVKKCSILWSV